MERLISLVRHHDALTVATREIDAKSNGIPAFRPLLADIADNQVRGAVFTMDALHGTLRGPAAWSDRHLIDLT